MGGYQSPCEYNMFGPILGPRHPVLVQVGPDIVEFDKMPADHVSINSSTFLPQAYMTHGVPLRPRASIGDSHAWHPMICHEVVKASNGAAMDKSCILPTIHQEFYNSTRGTNKRDEPEGRHRGSYQGSRQFWVRTNWSSLWIHRSAWYWYMHGNTSLTKKRQQGRDTAIKSLLPYINEVFSIQWWQNV